MSIPRGSLKDTYIVEEYHKKTVFKTGFNRYEHTTGLVEAAQTAYPL
jgi:hypothetical protein